MAPMYDDLLSPSNLKSALLPDAEVLDLYTQLQESPAKSQSMRVYKRRWVILFAFSFLNFCNASLWITFAPVRDQASKYYNVSPLNIDWFSIVFMITYIAFFLPASWALSKSLYWSFIFSNALNCLGAFIRYFAGSNFTVSLIGQVVVSIAQPFILCVPPALSDVWFPPGERANATTYSSLANYFGVAVGYLIPSLILSAVGESESFEYLTLFEAALCLFALILGCLVFRKGPPTPPSKSSQVERFSFRSSLASLLKNKRFIVLAVGTGIVCGSSYALTTLLEEFSSPFNFTRIEVGLMGLLNVLSGVAGGLLASQWVQKTKRYSFLIRGFFVLSVLAMLGFVLSIQFLCKPLLIFFNALAGVGLIGFLPIALESGVEDTFPVPEALSATTVLFAAQIGGIFLTLLSGWMGSAGSWSHVIALSFAAFLLLLFYPHSDHARSQIDDHGETAHLRRSYVLVVS